MPVYDSNQGFTSRDPTGAYVLSAVMLNDPSLKWRCATKNIRIVKAFRGRKAQDLYYTIFEYEKKHALKWFSRKDHAAYLGKELKKCEFALAGKENYLQE